MRRRKSATFALAVLQHFVPDSEALAGDLMEEYGRGRSGGWLWSGARGSVRRAARPRRRNPSAETRGVAARRRDRAHAAPCGCASRR
jgi:hypothetical protein